MKRLQMMNILSCRCHIVLKQHTQLIQVITRCVRAGVSVFQCRKTVTYFLSLLKADLLQGAHQSRLSVRAPKLGSRLQLAQLEVHGTWVTLAVLTAEWDKRLQFPSGYHHGSSLFMRVRHESPISAFYF